MEFTKFGTFVRQSNVDASQGGAFGIATINSFLSFFNFGGSFNYAAIDDVANDVVVSSILLGD